MKRDRERGWGWERLELFKSILLQASDFCQLLCRQWNTAVEITWSAAVFWGVCVVWWGGGDSRIINWDAVIAFDIITVTWLEGIITLMGTPHESISMPKSPSWSHICFFLREGEKIECSVLYIMWSYIHTHSCCINKANIQWLILPNPACSKQF